MKKYTNRSSDANRIIYFSPFGPFQILIQMEFMVLELCMIDYSKLFCFTKMLNQAFLHNSHI